MDTVLSMRVQVSKLKKKNKTEIRCSDKSHRMNSVEDSSTNVVRCRHIDIFNPHNKFLPAVKV